MTLETQERLKECTMQTNRAQTGVVVVTALTGVAFAAAAAFSTAAIGQADPSADADAALMAELMDEGAAVYRSCSGCHGSQGEGQPPGQDAAPELAGNYALLSVGGMVHQVVNGGDYMPPFANITNREIAAVATYIRNSFGNEYGIVTEEEVAEVR